MWMCAGFTMLEAGSVRTKNASVVCLKNIGLYSIAGLASYSLGYQIMLVGVEPGGVFSIPGVGFAATKAQQALLAGEAAELGIASFPEFVRAEDPLLAEDVTSPAKEP